VTIDRGGYAPEVLAGLARGLQFPLTMNAPMPTAPDTGNLSTLLPGVVPSPVGAGLRGPHGAAGDKSQASDFASFIALLSAPGLELHGLPPVPGLNAALPTNGAKAMGLPEAWGLPPLLKLLVPGGRFSPPGGAPLPPGLPQSEAGSAHADASRVALLSALAGSQTSLPTGTSQSGLSDALSPFLTTVANAGAMPNLWTRTLLGGDRSMSEGDALLVESGDAVMAGDASLAPAVGTRATSPTTAVVVPANPAQQPAFEQALGERLAWLVQEGRHDARIKLHPAELGSVDIRLSVDGDSTRISLASPHAAVRDALEQAVPRLRELLGHAGLDLGHVNVGTGDSRSHSDFRNPFSQPVTGVEPATLVGDSESGAIALALRLPQGLVDTFA